MVPVLMLEAEPHHRVLDACAAPGMKTTQVLDMLHRASDMPKGFVMANDADGRRCSMLAHHSRRMRSPAFIITHHDATTLPAPPAEAPELPGFDRILCDVPCTGDGTMRKAPHLFRKWSPAGGFGLHPLQLRIALRAARLLRVGGTMCYSTCSLNPVENEAVVAALVAAAKGALQVVDVSKRLPELKRDAGLTKWKVMTPDLKLFESHSEAVAAGKTSVRPSFFPPSEEEATAMGLPHCLRLMPHLGDTGGFFVCILTKLKDLPEESEQDELAELPPAPAKKDARGAKRPAAAMEGQEDDEAAEIAAALVEAGAVVGSKSDLPKMIKDDPFFQLLGEEVAGGADTVKQICEFFHLSADFPAKQLFARNAMAQKIVMVSPSICHVLVSDVEREFKAINSGVRVFEKCNFMSAGRACQFRVMQEGVRLVAPYMQARKVQLTPADFAMALAEKSLAISKFEAAAAQSGLQDLSLGSVVLHCEEPVTGETLFAVAEKGHAHDEARFQTKEKVGFIQVFVEKDEALLLLQRIDPAHPALTSAKAPVAKTGEKA